MYDIALSAAACVRSGTRIDVAWIHGPDNGDEAIAFTPGGGRFGALANGAFDGLIEDVAARQLSLGRHLVHEVSPLEAQASGLAAGASVELIVVPGDAFPSEIWQMLLDREPVRLELEMEQDRVVGVRLLTSEESVGEHCLLAAFAPIPRLVVAGAGPIAEALTVQGQLLGWKVAAHARPDIVSGLTATLTWMDAVVILGHDVESSGRCLMAALASEAGYIGSVGSHAMQQARADWLAYQDVTDLSRVHGPAGLDIGARTPAEVAVAITAEVLAGRSLRTSP